MTTFVKPDQIYQQGSRTLPREYYASTDIFSQEMQRIFLRRWVCVGRTTDLVEPGAYFLVFLDRESIIVVRDRTGVIRAFYNVCRHRGTRLCDRERGRFPETIQCPYHAWTYNLEGTLISAPHMDGVVGFDKHVHRLRSVPVHACEGFLFVSLADVPEPVEVALQSLTGRFSRFNLPALRTARRIEYYVRANWKLICQNYSECLHGPIIHLRLAKLSPYQSGENDLVDGPCLGGFMTLNERGASMTMSGRTCGVPVGDLQDVDIHRVYYYTVFPNLLLSLHPDYVMFHTLWPRTNEQTRIVCEWLFHPDSFEHPSFDPDDAVEFWDMTNRQDWNICEASQAGIRSRAYVPGPYAPREALLAAWDRQHMGGAAEGS